MKGWIDKQIDNATWARFLIAFLLLFVYGYWVFAKPGAWTRAKEAAGPLPETLQGFPDGQPALAFSKLGEATGDYLYVQVLDIPFAILNMAMIATALALGLRRFDLRASPLKYALVVPLVLVASEFIEDPLLFLMASGRIPDSGTFATIQQVMTNIKGVSGMLGMMAALFSVAATASVDAMAFFRKTG